MSKHESFLNAIAKGMRSDDAPAGDLSKSNIEMSANRLVDRRLFLKGVAVTGAVAAMYAVPKLTSVHSRPAYASITGGGCPPDFCIEWGSNKYAVKPIEYPGTIQEFYGYGSPDAVSANTPSVQLELSSYNADRGLEEITHNTNGLVGDILVFALVKTSDGNVHLITILDSPFDGSPGKAKITYTGVPNGTIWSVKDDDGLGGDVHNVVGTTANLDVSWLAARTDGGTLTPPHSNKFDCNTRICVVIDKSTAEFAGIGPICFATQKTPPDSTWIPNYNVANTKAPVIRLHEVGGDFCIDGSWSSIT